MARRTRLISISLSWFQREPDLARHRTEFLGARRARNLQGALHSGHDQNGALGGGSVECEVTALTAFSENASKPTGSTKKKGRPMPSHFRN